MSPLTDNILLKVCSKIMDEVTTTDELIPSGVTSSYRSNVMNWGMIPFKMKEEPEFEVGSYIYIPNIRTQLAENKLDDVKAYVIGDDVKEIHLYTAPMTDIEREIVEAGCLINYNRNRK